MAIFDTPMGQGSVLRFEINQDAQSIAGNYSIDSWALSLFQGGATSSWTATPRSWSVNVHGQVYSGSFTFDFRSSDMKLIATGSTQIAHNTDGTASIPAVGSIGATGTVVGGPASTGGWFTQSTIPRASTPSYAPAPMTIGYPTTIYTNRLSAAFSHTATWAFGNASGVIATGIIDSVSWTPPVSMMNEIPNATSGVGTLYLHTYSGSTHIGMIAIGFTALVAAEVAPDFVAITASEANTTVQSIVGAYVQGISQLNLAITGAVGLYGSSIVSHRIEVAGQTINAASGVSGPIAASGTVTITGTVTDSRGRSASKTMNINVLPYTQPSIDAPFFQNRRSDVLGALKENGTHIRTDLKASVSSLVVGGVQKNSLTYKIYTRLRGTTPWTLKKTVTPAGVAFNNFDVTESYAIENAWNVQVEVIDKFYTATIAGTVATAAIFMHWGTGLGVGKFWEQGALDVIGQIYQNDGEPVLSATALEARSLHYTGAVEAFYTAGLPRVSIVGVGTVTVSSVPSDLSIRGGDTVTLVRISGAYHIVNKAASTTKFPQHYRIPMTAGVTDFDPQDGVWIYPRVTKADGIVSLSGLMLFRTATATGTVIGVLPEGFRPDSTMYVAVNQSDSSSIIQIFANGNIVNVFAAAVGQYISLSGIAFPAAGVADWTVVQPQGSGAAVRFDNGWTHWGGGTSHYGTCRVWKDPITGLIWSTGLAAGGTTSLGTVMIHLGSTFGAKKTNHIVTEVAGGFGYFYSAAGSNVISFGGGSGNSDLSLAGKHWEPPGGAYIPFKQPYMESWVPYDGGAAYTVPEYMRSPQGLVYMHGLMSGSALGTSAFRLPEEHRQGNLGFTGGAGLYHAVSNNNRARFDTTSQGGIIMQQGSGVWYSIDSTVFASEL